MSFLNQMKAKKKEMFTVKHPLHEQDDLLKISYLIGIALLLARADDNFNEAERALLADMVESMDMPESRLETVVNRAKEASGDLLDELIPFLTMPGVAHCFVLDLHRAARADREFKDEEREFIAHITEMMQLGGDETAFLTAFADAAHAVDHAAANAAVQQAIEKKIEVDIRQLQFFLPGFNYVRELAGFELGAHESRELSGTINLVSPITVGKGAKLSIRNATLTFQACAQLRVCGGTLDIENSTCTADGTNENSPLLVVDESTPVLEVKKSVFDGSAKRPLVATLAGKSVFTGCTFKNGFRSGTPVKLGEEISGTLPGALFSLAFTVSTKMVGKMTSTDSAATEEESSKPVMGAAIVASSLLLLQDCTFSDLIAETGAGAVHAAGQLQMTNCCFSNCQSQGIGGAVVASDSYTITGCRFENCSANDCGGALYICGGHEENSKLENSTFTRCASTKNGGGLYIHEVKYAVNCCIFEDCSATEAGGGTATNTFSQYGSWLRQCQFNRCTAKEGGGLRVQSDSAQYSLPERTGTTYTDCLPDGYKQVAYRYS